MGRALNQRASEESECDERDSSVTQKSFLMVKDQRRSSAMQSVLNERKTTAQYLGFGEDTW